MNAPLTPKSTEELCAAVTAAKHLVPIGAGTKPRLSWAGDHYTQVSVRALCGVVEYLPEEYTITALAGTPVADIQRILGERDQYLPFDPLFPNTGATLGGSVASGLNGPGRFRFGGVRDFILGVRFVDGSGRCLSVGGKVVKNAAGFDVPKFLAGSLGRFGVLTEITVKVLPRPRSTLTLRLSAKTREVTRQILITAAASRWQPDALDVPTRGDHVLLRLAGSTSALKPIASEILKRWPGETLPANEADQVWTEIVEMRWTDLGGVLLKVPMALRCVTDVMGLRDEFPEIRVHISSGGNVAYLSLPDVELAPEFDARLRSLGLGALALRGQTRLWMGNRPRTQLATAIKDVFDPQRRFPSLDEDDC